MIIKLKIMKCSRIGLSIIYCLATTFILAGCILQYDFFDIDKEYYHTNEFKGELCFLIGSILFCIRSYLDLIQSITYTCYHNNDVIEKDYYLINKNNNNNNHNHNHKQFYQGI